MTWREFQLKKAGWEREQLRQWERTRMVAYWSGVDGGFDGKKTNITKFMPLGKETVKTQVSDEQRQAFKDAMEKYNEQKKELNGR